MVRVNVLDGCRGSSPLTRGKRSRQHRSLFMARLIPAHAGKTSSPPLSASSARAHPRSRGENSQAEETMRPRTGSSPLTRGKRCRELMMRVSSGLIPAHAGKTGRTPTRAKSSTAHPRSRGENAARIDVTDIPAGSSPLTRGKPHVVVEVAGFGGLIPAHAGKTGC